MNLGYFELEHLTERFHRLHINDGGRAQPRRKLKAPTPQKQNERKRYKPVRVVIDPRILHINGTNITYRYLNRNTQEYREINDLFIKSKLIVKSIRTIENPYLNKAFQMKQKFMYGNAQPKTLFHGTKLCHVDDICTYNFDWRLSGSETGHKFGKGVYFSKSPYFAAFFCDRKKLKVMIIADVLMNNITSGNENTRVPPKGYDTITAKRGTVFAKFYDNEFCPRYVVDFIKIFHQ